MPIPVSILICTHNRREALRQTLATVAGLAIPEALTPELIVVDNGSTDGTSDMVRTFRPPNMPVRLVQEPRPGAGHARNAALRAARGEILLFADDDVRLPANWLAVLCAPILADTADVVGGRVVLPPSLLRPWMTAFHRKALAATEGIDPDDPVDLISASMALSRRVLEKVPAFDPELGPGTATNALEDTLFTRQARAAGFRITTAFDAPVEHHFSEHRLTRRAFLRAAQARGRSLSYIHYHWYHRPASDWTHRTAPWQVWRTPHVLLGLRYLRLWGWRLRHPRSWLRQEGITKTEFYHVISIYRMKQFMRDRRRPPHYARQGLVKRSGEATPA